MSAIIECASAGNTRLLKLGGSLRHDNAAPLETLIERWFAPELVSAIDPNIDVIIDLNQLQFMDSTVIGLLAAIARELAERELAPAVVFSSNEEINQLLHSLCLDQVFTLVQQGSEDAEFGPCAVEANGTHSQVSAAGILRAHELLIEVNEANRVAFQPVVDLLRGELQN